MKQQAKLLPPQDILFVHQSVLRYLTGGEITLTLASPHEQEVCY